MEWLSGLDRPSIEEEAEDSWQFLVTTYHWMTERITLEVAIINKSNEGFKGAKFESETYKSDHETGICASIEVNMDFYWRRLS